MKRILIISDGKKGHLNQSIAFCKIKDISYDILEIEFKSKFSKSLSYIYDKCSFFTDNLFKEHREYNYEFYDAVVSTGSGTYYFNKLISKKFNIKSIALMLPKSYNYKDFYYIVAQYHDNPPKLENIIRVPLNISYSKAQGMVNNVENRKSVGLIIGGNNDIFTIEKESIKQKIDSIFKDFPNHLKYVTTSRRTPAQIEDLIDSYTFDYKLIYSNEPTKNPIPDFLEQCDELFITIDSTSMLSEAKANSEAKINIIELKSKKEDTKFHKLAKTVSSLEQKVDFEKLLKRVEI